MDLLISGFISLESPISQANLLGTFCNLPDNLSSVPTCYRLKFTNIRRENSGAALIYFWISGALVQDFLSSSAHDLEIFSGKLKLRFYITTYLDSNNLVLVIIFLGVGSIPSSIIVSFVVVEYCVS